MNKLHHLLLLVLVLEQLPIWPMQVHGEGPHWGDITKQRCKSPGVAEFSARIWDTGDMDWDRACKSLPAMVNGELRPAPNDCVNEGVFGMRGVWFVVDYTCAGMKWGPLKKDECKENGWRKTSARLLNIPVGVPRSEWRSWCKLWAIVVDGTYYGSPHRCVLTIFGVWGIVYHPDTTCCGNVACPRENLRRRLLGNVASLCCVYRNPIIVPGIGRHDRLPDTGHTSAREAPPPSPLSESEDRIPGAPPPRALPVTEDSGELVRPFFVAFSTSIGRNTLELRDIWIFFETYAVVASHSLWNPSSTSMQLYFELVGPIVYYFEAPRGWTENTIVGPVSVHYMPFTRAERMTRPSPTTATYPFFSVRSNDGWRPIHLNLVNPGNEIFVFSPFRVGIFTIGYDPNAGTVYVASVVRGLNPDVQNRDQLHNLLEATDSTVLFEGVRLHPSNILHVGADRINGVFNALIQPREVRPRSQRLVSIMAFFHRGTLYFVFQLLERTYTLSGTGQVDRLIDTAHVEYSAVTRLLVNEDALVDGSIDENSQPPPPPRTDL